MLSILRNEFSKFNNTRARMFDYIYHLHKIYFEISFRGVNKLNVNRMVGRIY